MWTASKEQLLWKLDEFNTKHDIQKTNRSTELPSYRFRTSEIDSIPYIQAIRIKRICTTSQDF